MKTLIVFAIIFAFYGLAKSDDFEGEANDHMEACMEGTGIQKEDIDQFEKDFSQHKLEAANVPDALKCFTKCVLVKMGFVDADSGQLLSEAVKTKFSDRLPLEQVEDILVPCKDQAGDNPCDTSFKIISCIHKKMSI